MVHPVRDLTICLVAVLAGLAALFWGLPDMIANRRTVAVGVGVAGGFIAFFAFLLIPNFLWGLRLRRRMQRGEGLIARWTVPAPLMANFIRWERTQGDQHWTPRPGRAVDIAIAPEHALVDGQIYTMPTSGPQAVRSVHWLEGEPPVLLFTTATFEARGATVQTYGTRRGRLRIPVGDRAAGSRVLRAYEDMLAGRVLARPHMWTRRIRIGQGMMLAALAAGLWGGWMADRTGWSVNDPRGMAAMVAMIAGAIFLLAGAAVIVLASAFRRRQRGQAGR